MSKYRPLTRDFFVSPPRTVTFDVPRLECTVTLRELSAGTVQDGARDIVQQLQASIVDESGDPIFDAPDQIRNMPLQAYTQILDEFLKLNGATKEAIDEAVKNSETSRTGASAIG